VREHGRAGGAVHDANWILMAGRITPIWSA